MPSRDQLVSGSGGERLTHVTNPASERTWDSDFGLLMITRYANLERCHLASLSNCKLQQHNMAAR